MYIGFISSLKQLPFVRIIIPFIAGITIQLFLPLNFSFFLPSVIFLILILILTEVSFKGHKQYNYRFFSGIILHLLIFISGAKVVSINTPETFKYFDEKHTYIGVITEPVSEKDNSYKTYVRLEYISLNDTIIKLNNNLIIYFEKSEQIKQLSYGDEIIFNTVINEINSLKNPYEFNYKQFMYRKGFIGQAYIKNSKFEKLKSKQGNLIFETAYNAGNFVESIYKTYQIKNQEAAVLQALTIGNKDDIDETVKQSYVSSGAMHILAVSGLHVGIIYVLLNFFFRFLDRLKTNRFSYGKIIKAIILVTLLWAFAFISGLSPSVRRAALMFSFVIIGRAMNNKVNIYNSIAASAFILLLINPMLITEVGFQLSYAAVISIVYFQPIIVNLIIVKNKFLYYFWSLTAVSIAAQIGTAPFSLFYFHIFPWYFILTNIIVIPAAAIIIYASFVLILFSFAPVLPEIVAGFLNFTLKSLNYSVNFIEHLPFSSSQNISFNFLDLFFSAFIIIFSGFFIAFKTKKTIFHILLLLFFWIGFSTFNKVQNIKQQQLVIYNIKDNSAINIIGDENYLIANHSQITNEIIKYGPLNYWMNLNKTDYIPIEISDTSYKCGIFEKINNFLILNDKTLLIINNENQLNFKSENKLFIDIIILTDNVPVKIEAISDLFITDLMIFDSSNKKFVVNRWENECEQLNQTYYTVYKNGAFQTDL